jgi:hypothetical protein
VNNQEILNKSTEAQRFAKYEYKAPDITKDGHTMFNKDVVKDLNRKSFLESELIEFKNRIAELKANLKDAYENIGFLSTHLRGRMGEQALLEMAEKADKWKYLVEKGGAE